MRATIQARLDPEAQQAVETLTRRLGMSPSEVVRASLLFMVKQQPVPKKKTFLGVGKFESGIGDLATNKKHMEGFGLTRQQRAKLEDAEKTR